MRRSRGYFLALVILIFLGTPRSLLAQGADTVFVTPEVSSAVVQIGQPFQVRVGVIKENTGDLLTGPQAPVTLGELDILKSASVPTASDSLYWDLEVSLFEPGERTLPEIPFYVNRLSGAVPVRLNPYTISVVTTVEVDSAGAMPPLRALRDPIAGPTRWIWWRVGLAVAGLALAALAVWWLMKRRKRPPQQTQAYVPRLAPDVEAMQAFSELEREAYPDRGMLKEHFSGLSMIVRRYIERRFGVMAVESTTSELQADLGSREYFSESSKQRLFDLLERSDMVKFAKFRPENKVAAEDLNLAKQWVSEVQSQTSLSDAAVSSDELIVLEDEAGGGDHAVR
ncbi:MAG: hypothetical protein HKN21_00415 [Candidatus Eisenbacteria bacterium]|uniref:Protein BatD n=1 Tax=Eiseniibacteriota bacterium TaxID=2212470 RepID=A0A7Y2H0R3_UNCEI|nr:hypothetical protein [Candidatus Eisenbacteria bacterium]